MEIIVEDQVIKGKSFTESPLPVGRYENCVFQNCIFANSSLSQIQFIDCSFIDCDLSIVKAFDTAFKKVLFKDSKLIGVHFNRAHEFMLALEFDNCLMNMCSFNSMKLKKTNFFNCILREVDFRHTDLSESTFDECDLLQALFEETNLNKADLRKAYNFSIDPLKNRIQKAKFSKESVLGLLDKMDIIID